MSRVQLFRYNNNNRGTDSPSRNNRNNNINDCERKWEIGVGYSRDIFAAPFVSVRPAHQCTIKYNKKTLYISLNDLNREEFINNIPLLDDKPEREGYYTWLIYSNHGSTDKHFVACKTYSILEIATIHIDIAERVNAKRIHAAGELHVDNKGKIIFNLQSGTYTKLIFNSTKKRSRCDRDKLENFIVEKVKEYLGEDSIFDTRILITEKNLPIHKDELNLYKMHGAVIEEYDTPEECKKSKGRNNNSNSGGGLRKTRRRSKF